MDQFIDEKGHLKSVRLESLDNTMPGNIIVRSLRAHSR